MPDKSTLIKRARAKYLSSNFALKLKHFNPDSPLSKSYTSTFYCTTNILDEGDGYLKAKYCKNRWCAVCNRIRTGVLINSYGKQLDELFAPYFMTLTLPTCKAEDLSKQIERMEAAWRQIYNQSFKARYKNSGNAPLRGVRKMECTIRPNGYYHFHYHVIIDTWATAEWIVYQWLKRFPEASDKAQDIRPADARSMKELFKYFTKVSADGKIAPYQRLDVIFRAIRGKRTYQPFGGFRVTKGEDIDELQKNVKKPSDKHGNLWKWDKYDWISEHGELLTGYEPNDLLKQLWE